MAMLDEERITGCSQSQIMRKKRALPHIVGSMNAVYPIENGNLKSGFAGGKILYLREQLMPLFRTEGYVVDVEN